MNFVKKDFFVLLLVFLLNQVVFASTVKSPDGKIVATFFIDNEGKPFYSVSYNNKMVVEKSALGLETSNENFTHKLRIISESQKRITDKYTLLSGKQTKLKAVCNEKEFVLNSAQNTELRILFRAYNEGVAFRYLLPEGKTSQAVMLKELTTFDIPDDALMWISRYSIEYQSFFTNGASVKTPSPNRNGSWCYPALFKTNNCWMLLTEAGVTENYCATHLRGNINDGSFSILFPDSTEAQGFYDVQPTIRLPFASPWRVMAVGENSADILQSSLVTHLSEPSKIKDESWIKAGRSSWSWWSDTKKGSKTYDILKNFVDLSVRMGWEYSLVDACWDIMQGGDVKQLIDYANTKNIGIWLWYNSAGIHNKVLSQTPRDVMHDPVLRKQEFEKISKWGVKGIKVDFFSSDKQEIIKLYLGILRDAAEYKLMVDFHGCTTPRGWQRTYPNLMTMEAVAGAEIYGSDKPWWAEYGKTSPTHNTILPFTRNVIGSMDYTPVTFTNKVQPHLTTNTHELALSVVFESGLQCFADKGEAYDTLHVESKRLLQEIPASWDETRYIDGFPGKYVVIARRSGKKWYVGGINGQTFPQEVTLNLNKFRLNHLVTDNSGLIPASIKNKKGMMTIKMDTYGGFVAY
jgi:hypothetical protein